MSTSTLKKANINVSEIEEGDIFSEQSHYVFDSVTNTSKYKFLHLESGKPVYLDEKYVTDLLQTADQFHTEVEVGLEDKFWTAKQLEDARGRKGSYGYVEVDTRVGDLRQKGILSIWDDIHSAQVFTVNFNKANKEMGTKAITEAKDKQLQDGLAKIAAAQKAKKGVAIAAAQVLRDIQDNPIIPITKGDERTLRGYKTQFSSINGLYDVVDMEIEADEKAKGSPHRQVNVRAINWLVFNGIKYVVK